jgi:hypothetical protein
METAWRENGDCLQRLHYNGTFIAPKVCNSGRRKASNISLPHLHNFSINLL